MRVEMLDYDFSHKGAVSAGRVVFQVKNAGRTEHEMITLRLPEDVPRIDVQLRSARRRTLPVCAGLPPSPPGGRSIFAGDLSRGRYALVCFLTDGEGVQHWNKGMSSEFTVT